MSDKPVKKSTFWSRLVGRSEPQNDAEPSKTQITPQNDSDAAAPLPTTEFDPSEDKQAIGDLDERDDAGSDVLKNQETNGSKETLYELSGQTSIDDPSLDIIEQVNKIEDISERVDEVSQNISSANPRLSWRERLSRGLRRSSSQLGEGIMSVFTHRKLDENSLEELEDLLIQSDMGIDVAEKIIGKLRSERFDKDIEATKVQELLSGWIAQTLLPVAKPLEVSNAHKPHVILMAGVNGAGKTTTIGKLAHMLKSQGRSVLLAAGDTFRAAAIEQLQRWAERTQSDFLSMGTGADASGLAYAALEKAQKDGIDVVIIDTAGRLHTKNDLMDELRKIVRVLRKLDSSAPHTSLLVLDATTGQNAIKQAESFRDAASTTGLVMTKLDGTARGGILLALSEKVGLPIHFIGVGETLEDLETFNAGEFSRALFGLSQNRV